MDGYCPPISLKKHWSGTQHGTAYGGSAEKGPWARRVSRNRVCPIMPKFDR